MARQKTTKAEIHCARFNPIHPEELRVIEAINYWKERGFNFKQLVTDRILRVEGVPPEFYGNQHEVTSEAIAGVIEPLLERFAQEIIEQLRAQGVAVQGHELSNDDLRPSTFAKTFASSFMKRQQQGLGDDE